MTAPASKKIVRPALPGWTSWLLLRLGSGALAVVALSLIVFVATQALPSDPARVILGPDAPEATVAILQRQLGLDRPIVVQYASWLGRALRGDFGVSLDSSVPVAVFVRDRLANTLALVVLVAAMVIPTALLLGVVLAVRRDSRFDRAVVAALVFVKALPVFAVAIALIMLLSTTVVPLLPAVSLLDPTRSPFAQPQFLALPALTLFLATLSYLVRLVRVSMIEVLNSEYVTQARLRGIPAARILWRHALPNALIPTIQGVALMLSVLLGGGLVVEVLFTYPGVGGALNAAVEGRDLPVIQAIVLVVTTGVVGVNLGADLLTVLLTPRLRTAQHLRLAAHRTGKASALLATPAGERT